MKALVRFAPGAQNDIFEGTRLRKNIKGALELNDIKWVDSLFSDPDVCHYLSPLDEPKAREAKSELFPVVVSALYAENDPKCRYLERDSNDFYSVNHQAMKLLELADVILVPSLSIKNLLYQLGVTNPNIQIVTPGVNLARFAGLAPIEEEIFQRYYRLSKDEKYIISVGEFSDKKTIFKLKSLAETAQNYKFFFFGAKTRTSKSLISKLGRSSPGNLKFCHMPGDDVFRSGLIKASVFLEVGEALPEPLQELEAMAAKVPVMKVGNAYYGGYLSPNNNCILVKDVEEAANILNSLSTIDTNKIIIEGYKTAKANSLSRLGKTLEGIYKSLLEMEVHQDD